jgi:putative ABC transport system permease protein
MMDLFTKTLQMLTTSSELGLLYGLMVLGVWLSYRILDIPDLTVDGSFTLGTAVSCMLALAGYPLLAILGGALAGALAGAVTACLQTKLKISAILSGILTMTALYSINIMVMANQPNRSLIGGVETIFTLGKKIMPFKQSNLIVGLIFAVLVGIILNFLMKTQLGLALRATGDNEEMVRASSINVDTVKIIGLALSNGLVGMSGALICQQQLFADVNMGVGMIVIGVASLIIGEVIFGKKSIGRHLAAAVLGAIAYRLIIALALECNLSSSSMKLVSSLIVGLAVSYPVLIQKKQMMQQRRKRKC